MSDHRIARLGRRLRLLVFRRRAEQAMDRELTAHIDAEVSDLVARGVPLAEARRRALAEFGGIEAVKEAARDARGGRAVDDILRDLSYGWRVLRRSPGHTTLAVLTFALGTAASAAIFSVVYGVLLRPLPYGEPGELVALWERNIPRGVDRNVVSADSFLAWRDRARGFSAMAALVPAHVTVTAGGDPERVTGADVSPNFFAVLGVPPAIGRDFNDVDAQSGRAVMLSHEYWQTRFGGDPGIAGTTMPIDGRPVIITGVMPAWFEPPAFGWMGGERFWRPMTLTEVERSWGRYLHVVARLAPGAEVPAVRSGLEALALARAAEFPQHEGWSASIVPLAEQISGGARPALMALLVGVGIVLTMAVTNVATLTLSAMRRRSHELAVRRALGATDARLFRQLLVQSTVVGGLGLAAGLAAAVPATEFLISRLPPAMPRAASIALDLPVLSVVAGTNLLATLIFGTLAARRGRRAAAAPLDGRQPGGARPTAGRGGGALVSFEIAFGLAVGVMALLMVRSVASLTSVDLGFDPRGVLAVRLAAPPDRARSDESLRAFHDELVARAGAVAGVSSAALISSRPFYGIGPATRVGDALAPLPSPDDPSIIADVRFVRAGALGTLDVAFLAGREFEDAIDATGPPRVIVSGELASRVWPGAGAADVVGRRLRINLNDGITPEVIGIVEDVHLGSARTKPRAVAWLSAARFPPDEIDIVLRTSVPPESIVPALRVAVNELAPGLPIYRVGSMSALVDESLAEDRFTAWLLSGFAAVALALAAIGIFGVFSTDVVHRRREIGVRLALGGSARGVIAMLLRRAAGRAAGGLAAGLLLAWALGRNMRPLLFDVEPGDPVSMALVAAVIIALAAAATVVPAVQALRKEPLRALRES